MRVSHVLEELSRFNPDARVVPELEIGGISPATECQFGFSEKEELLERVEKLETQVSELEDEAHDAEERLSDGLDELEELCEGVPADLAAAILAKIKDLRP